MSVQILHDNDTGYKCLYCSTSMWAFGGIFYDDEDPQDFLDWVHPESVRKMTDQELEQKISEWRNK